MAGMGETRIHVSATGQLTKSDGSEPTTLIKDPGEYRLIYGPHQTFLLAKRRDSPRARATVLMMGELVHRMSVVEVMNLLTSSQWSGELHVASPQHTRVLVMAEGALKLARTDDEGERIGELLVRAGVLQRRQLAELLPQKSSDERFGQLLVRRGLIDEASLFKQLQAQTEAIFYACLLVESGSYWFVTPPETAALPLTTFHLPIHGLLMEGVQRIDEMTLYRERIPNNRAFPVENPNTRRDALDASSLAVLEQCNGTRSIDDLSRATGLGEFLTLKAVYGLLRGGHVQLRHGLTLNRSTAQRLIRAFNGIVRDVFVAVATYGSMERASRGLSTWLAASRHAGVLGEQVDIDGTLDTNAVLARLEQHNSEDPMQDLHQALLELAAYALFLASNGLPRNEERLLSRDVNHRLQQQLRL